MIHYSFTHSLMIMIHFLFETMSSQLVSPFGEVGLYGDDCIDFLCLVSCLLVCIGVKPPDYCSVLMTSPYLSLMALLTEIFLKAYPRG